MGTRSNSFVAAAPSYPMVLPKNVDNGDTSEPPPQTATTHVKSIPCTLSLQEDKSRPGQFQLVVNPKPEHTGPSLPVTGTGKSNLYGNRNYAKPQPFPTLGYDVSPLYRSNRPPSPLSPISETHGWSEINTLPPDFLRSVAPEWDLPIHRSDSITRSQSTRLGDIKARIKKSGKGFIVRLRKSGASDLGELKNDVKDVHLTAEKPETPQRFELSAECDAVELDSTAISRPVFEIGPSESTVSSNGGSSSVQSVHRAHVQPRGEGPVNHDEAVHTVETPFQSGRPTSHYSVGSLPEEQWLSDAETLTHEPPSINNVVWDDTEEDGLSTIGPASTDHSQICSRRSSISSIATTPTNLLARPEVRWPSQQGASSTQHAVETTVGPSDSSRPSPNRSVNSAEHEATNKSVKITQPRPPHPTSSRPTGQRTLSKPGVRKAGKKPISRDRVRQTTSAFAVLQGIEDTETDTVSVGRWQNRSTSLKSASSGRSVEHPANRRSRSFHTVSSTSVELQNRHTGASKAPGSPQSRVVKRRLRVRTSDLPNEGGRRVSPDISPGDTPGQATHIASTVHAEQGILLEREEQDTARFLASPQSTFHVSRQQTMEQTSASVEEEDQLMGAIPIPSNLELRPSPGPHKGAVSTFVRMALGGLFTELSNGLLWLRDRYGEEPPVPEGHVRVRWTCQCGEPLYDDFVERRRGAARELEAFLNRPQTRSPGTPTSSPHSRSSTMSSIFSNPIISQSSTFSSQTTLSSANGGTSGGRYSPTALRQPNPFSVRIGSYPTPSWLLTCANEGRFTTKLVHLDMCDTKIRSDKDFALALREHYSHVNRKWFRWLKLRGLTTIDFVQFEVHRNRFADIRKSPDMPPVSLKSQYDFEPIDLVPPVGSKYLLHLFKHPEDYDGELITYLRSPKRRERLEVGVGWGINLVEGFLAARVWTLVIGFFALGSLIFAIVWVCVKGDDVQGAFGVAAWMTTLAGLSVAWAQACLD